MEELFRKAKKGDEYAFSFIVEKVKRYLYYIAMSNLKNEDLADEVFQQTMISLYKNLNKIKDPNKVKEWCTIVLINKCKKIKRNKVITEIPYEDMEEFLISDNEFQSAIEKIDVFSAIEMLKPIDKDIMVYYYVENYTTKKISEIMGINENTIRTKIKRSKKILKDIMEENK